MNGLCRVVGILLLSFVCLVVLCWVVLFLRGFVVYLLLIWVLLLDWFVFCLWCCCVGYWCFVWFAGGLCCLIWIVLVYWLLYLLVWVFTLLPVCVFMVYCALTLVWGAVCDLLLLICFVFVLMWVVLMVVWLDGIFLWYRLFCLSVCLGVGLGLCLRLVVAGIGWCFSLVWLFCWIAWLIVRFDNWFVFYWICTYLLIGLPFAGFCIGVCDLFGVDFVCGFGLCCLLDFMLLCFDLICLLFGLHCWLICCLFYVCLLLVWLLVSCCL